jgi:large subunit ribosomal protein L4
MASINVYNQQNEQVGEIELDDMVFGAEVKEHLLHAVVRKQLAARRAGTHAVKRRSDVRGGGRKPFKQKGTGRARQGTSRAPHMRGGGVVFGPNPRSYDFKVNKREMRAALCGAISRRVAEGRIIVLDDIQFDGPKTKSFKAFLAAFGAADALLVVDGSNENVELSARNLQNVTVLPPVGVNVYDVLHRSQLFMTKSAVEAVTSRLGGAK